MPKVRHAPDGFAVRAFLLGKSESGLSPGQIPLAVGIVRNGSDDVDVPARLSEFPGQGQPTALRRAVLRPI